MAEIIFLTEDIDKAGGVARVVNMWANYFAKNNHNVQVIATNAKNPYYQFDEKVKIKDFKFEYNHKIVGIPYNIFQTYRLLNQLKKIERLNLIVDRAIHIEPIWLLQKFGLFKNINIVYFAHGGSSDFRDFYMIRPITRHKPKMIFEAFDKVICLYDDEKNYLKQVKKEKLHFIPNPLPFEPSNVTFEEKENIVLSLGRVTKEKGIDILIKAWAKVEAKFPDWKLKIVGDGKDKEEFIKLAKNLNLENIEFLPATTDVKPFYEKAKIFVIPSLFEGFGMTILEAMACKCCVVSSKTTGGKKLIENGKTGLLFEIGNNSLLTFNLIKLIMDKHKMEGISLNGYSSVQEYKIDKLTSKWIEVLC